MQTFIEWLVTITIFVVIYIIFSSPRRSDSHGRAIGASGRGQYGSLRNNLLFFSYVLAIPLTPWLVWMGVYTFVSMPPWLSVLCASFASTLSVGLGIITLLFLVVYPPFAQKFKWELITSKTAEGVPTWTEIAPTKWLEPWSYEVPEGKLMTRLANGGGVIDYTMRQGDAEMVCDVRRGPFPQWKNQYDIIDVDGSPSHVPVYSIWHRYHIRASGGLVFGGFAWYTKLHTYEIDIVKAEIGANGRIKLQIYPKSRTDHIRVRPFAWAVVADVYTKDKFRVSIIITFELRCVNPDKALFGKDRWERLFSQETTNKALEKASSITVFSLLEGSAASVRNEIALAVETLRDSIRQDLGIEVRKVQVPGYLEIGDNDDQRAALTAVAIANQQAKVTVIAGAAEAKSEAAVVRERGKATDASKYGVEVSLHQALETMGKTGGSVIANLGTGGDPMSSAILVELRKITEKLGGAS